MSLYHGVLDITTLKPDTYTASGLTMSSSRLQNLFCYGRHATLTITRIQEWAADSPEWPDSQRSSIAWRIFQDRRGEWTLDSALVEGNQYIVYPEIMGSYVKTLRFFLLRSGTLSRQSRRSVKVPFHYAGQAPGAPGTYSRIKHMTMDIALKRFASSAKGGQGRKHVEVS